MNRWLLTGGVMLVLAGVLVWECTAPEDFDEPPLAHAMVRAMTPRVDRAPRSDTAALQGIASSVLARPLFSPARRPPAEQVSDQPAAEATAEAPPRLAGVIVGPTRRSAIFADTTGRPRIIGEGDTIGRFTVELIAPNQVTLRSAAGERLVRPGYSESGKPGTVAAERPDPALAALGSRGNAD